METKIVRWIHSLGTMVIDSYSGNCLTCPLWQPSAALSCPDHSDSGVLLQPLPHITHTLGTLGEPLLQIYFIHFYPRSYAPAVPSIHTMLSTVCALADLLIQTTCTL